MFQNCLVSDLQIGDLHAVPSALEPSTKELYNVGSGRSFVMVKLPCSPPSISLFMTLEVNACPTMRCGFRRYILSANIQICPNADCNLLTLHSHTIG